MDDDFQPSVVTTPRFQPPKKSRKKIWIIAAALLLLAGGGAAAYQLTRSSPKPAAKAANTRQAKKPVAAKTEGLELDTSKNYGDKYASGLLPVGDGKYDTTAAKKGYVYACSTYAHNLSTTTNAGAGSRGPWFVNNNTQYDMNKKAHVSGSVNWRSVFSDTVSGNTRNITGNGLPNHLTGVFPVASSDAAYAYDRNPNRISAQSLSYALSAAPVYGSPQCMGGQSGIMLTGSPIFNGFDAGGRDAGAWEVQDGCDGHPEKSGQYHYHTLSRCITNINVSTVIGFALDGFPITGPKLGDKNILTTDDLDECHGIVSSIKLDGKMTKTYHYVMTQDFPYSVGCFRAQPVQTQPAGGQQGGPPPRQ